MSLVDEHRPDTPAHRAGGPPTPAAVPLVALLIGAVALGWQANLVLRGYFWQDDFVLIARAARSPLTGGYLVADHNGNLTPGGNLLAWLTTRLAPGNYPVAVAPVLVFALLALVLVWRLLSGVFGQRWAVLVPFTGFAAAPVLLSTSLWWSQALETGPVLVALLGAVHAQACYLRTGTPRYAVFGLLCTAGGLLFWDKALLIPIVVLGLTAVLAPPQPAHRALGWALRRHWPLWLGYLLLCLAYLVFYLTHTSDPGGGRSTPGDLLALAGRLVGQTFLPGVAGGPWRAAEPFQTVWDYRAPWVLGLVWAGAALVVAGSVLLRRSRAALAWLVLAVYLVAIVALLAVARLPRFGPAAGNDPRFVADAVPVAVLCAALAFLRPAGEAVDGPAPVLRWVRPAVLALTVAFAAGGVVTASTFWPQYSHAAARQYVQTARAALAGHVTALYDTAVPPDVLVPLFGPAARTSTVFGPLPGAPPFDAPAEDLRILDRTGVPRPVQLTGAAAARPGPVRDCGYPLGTEPAELPLTSTVDGARLVVRIGYYSVGAATGSIQAGPTARDVAFLPGLHVLYVVADGPIDRIRLWHNGSGDTVCVSDVLVGTPVAGG